MKYFTSKLSTILEAYTTPQEVENKIKQLLYKILPDIGQANIDNWTLEIEEQGLAVKPHSHPKFLNALEYVLKEIGIDIIGKTQPHDHPVLRNEGWVTIPISKYETFDLPDYSNVKTQNQAMYQALTSHPPQALDVNEIGIKTEIPGTNVQGWKLNEFHDGIDYVDAQSASWISEIVKNEFGEIYASSNSFNYGKDDTDYETIWLR